jgi:uncharacterized protein YcbK (DUF882 family)
VGSNAQYGSELMSKADLAHETTRRSFLRIALGLAVPAAVCPMTFLGLAESVRAEGAVPLRLYNANTRERYDVQLFEGDAWNRPGVLVCDWMMRDWRQKQTVECDRRLYAALYVIQRKFGISDPVIINSGFRSNATNGMLRANSIARRGGVSWETPAVNSQHTHAKAVDFVIPGVSPQTVAAYVETLRLGGVGNYDNFTHMDTARVRRWGPRSS